MAYWQMIWISYLIPLQYKMQFIKEQGIGSGDNSSPPSSSLTWNPALNNGAGGFE